MTQHTEQEEELLRSVALQNATTILRARQQAERELLQAKDALRESEERLRATFEQAAVGICVAALDGKYVQMNRKFCDILGYSEERLRGMTFADINHPDDVQPTRKLIDDLLAGSIDHYALEKRYLRGDGSTIWGRATVTLLRDQAGAPARFIGVIEDISQRKAAESALSEETRMLEVLNRTGTMLASSLELQELLQAVTDSATELSGARFGAFFYNAIDEQGEVFQLYTLSGAPRAAFEKFGHPRATPIFAPTFRGEGVIRIADVTRDPRYGQWGPHHGMPPGHLAVRSYLSVPVMSRSGEVIGGLFFGHPETSVFTERSERLVRGVAAQAGVAIDNARLYEASRKAGEERKLLLESERHARAAAERASRMKDEFLATLSHELRTPLSAILGWAHLLRNRESPDREELRKGLETIERNARMQTQLIEDLLDMSRITSGKVRLDIQPVMPVTLIEAALETVRPAAEARGVRLQPLLDSDAGPVAGDPARLQQVVWNLLNNAIKFTPRDGRVQVLLERVNSHVEITIADTGAGIEPEFLDHVFERFRQADASSTRQFGGLGLGLAIVKNLVELHGGTVRARSAGKDQGATFSVHLPLLVARQLSSPGAAARQHPGTASAPTQDFRPVDLSGVRVLVVDDQPDARELVARILGDCGAEVMIAAHAREALELVERRRPMVVVSDIGMPEVDGYELLKQIRSLGAERGGNVPAIALTAFARSEDRTRALHRGFQVHVAKPVEPAELIATVASVAGRTGV